MTETTIERHDYEPGETAHPMSTDPDCCVCGRTRRSCDERANDGR